MTHHAVRRPTPSHVFSQPGRVVPGMAHRAPLAQPGPPPWLPLLPCHMLLRYPHAAVALPFAPCDRTSSPSVLAPAPPRLLPPSSPSPLLPQSPLPRSIICRRLSCPTPLCLPRQCRPTAFPVFSLHTVPAPTCAAACLPSFLFSLRARTASSLRKPNGMCQTSADVA